MCPDFLDLLPSVLLRVFLGKEAHRGRRGVTRFFGELFIRLQLAAVE
jgi:hypothetical protein